jgi:predicted Zn-dependent peptidase
MCYERFELANGLRVVAAPMSTTRSVTIAIFLGVGSRFERDEEAGIAHFIEHMLFKGTERRPTPRMIAETIESVGGVLNASTDKEVTVYWAKTATEHFELGLDLLTDMLLHSRLLPREIAKEKAVIVEELSMTHDDPQEWVHTLIDEVLWPQHPLGRDVAGTQQSVMALQRSHLRRFMANYYGANNAVLAVAGGVEPNHVLQAAHKYLSAWQATPLNPTLQTAVFAHDQPHARFEVKPTEQVNLCLAYPALARDDPDRYALDILATLLGGSMSSRLFLEVRERLALVYDIHTYTNKLADTGSLVVYAGVDPKRANTALKAILQEIERLRQRLVPEEELNKTKRYMKGRLYLSFEDTQTVASWLGLQELLLGRIDLPETVVAAIERVSPQDIRRLAHDLLDRNRVRLAAVGPDGLDMLTALAA